MLSSQHRSRSKGSKGIGDDDDDGKDRDSDNNSVTITVKTIMIRYIKFYVKREKQQKTVKTRAETAQTMAYSEI